MAETTEKDPVELTIPVLPHQEVIQDLIEEGLIDAKKDLDSKLRQTMAGIEGRYKNQIQKGKEGAGEVQRSTDLADQLLEIAKQLRKKKAKEMGAPDTEELISQGDQAMTAGDLSTAEKFYNDALAMDPTNTYLQGQLDKIATQIEANNQQQELENKFNDHINAAVELMSSGQLKEARIHYEAALEIKPDDQGVIDAINMIDAHLNSSNGNVNPITQNPSHLVGIMNDIERTCNDRGKITTQELLDIGLTKFPQDKPEFPIGNKEKHGKSITLVKVKEGVYELKKKKGLSTGAKWGIGLGVAALVGLGIYLVTGKKRNG